MLAAIVVVAVAVRWYFLDRQTMDYQNFLSRWYQTLDTQGVHAFRSRFADYNYPYLYLVWLLTALNIPALVGIKALSIVFDFLLGFFAYRIVGLRTDRFALRALAFGIVVLLPSVVANSAWWGQADAIYSAFILGGVYFLLRARRDRLALNSILACAFFGMAVSFKLQAVFVLPVLMWLLIRRALPWYSLLAVPAVFVLLEVPALIAGAPLSDVVSVYSDQTDSYQQLTLGAANLYQLIPIAGDVTWLAHAGIVTAAAIIALFLGWSWWRKPPVTPSTILVVATASALIVPFLLPAMHDRYFYAVEVLSVVAAFYLPLWFILIPVLIQASAIGVYHSSLTGDQGHGMGVGGPGGGDLGRRGPGGGAPGGGIAGGGPGGGHPGGHRGTGGYSSGRGDTALTVYASMTALAVVGVSYAVVDTFRRAWPAATHRTSTPRCDNGPTDQP